MPPSDRKSAFTILLAVAALGIAGQAVAQPVDAPKACCAVQRGKQVELRSPLFTFCLDTANGLRAQSWENRLAAQTRKLGDGPELEIDIGLPDHALATPAWEVSGVQVKSEGEAGEVALTLTAREPALAALVTYRWDAKQPVLRKFTEITNQSDGELNRLLNVRLGTYRTDAQIACQQKEGFPAYLNGEFFVTLTHPAGWATGKDGQVSLRQYPGLKLAPGKRFACMEVVYGVGKPGEARKSFVAYLKTRMRRILRGQDKPIAMFEPFGSKPDGSFNESEEHLLDLIAKVAQGEREAGYHFDYFTLEFWVDVRGDLKGFDPVRFPNGMKRIHAELDKLGTKPALWIDSGGVPGWSIGDNPAVKSTFTRDPAKDPAGRLTLCRATEPIKSMYTEAFRYHIRASGARLLKFDNYPPTCSNPNHDHLPGIYSAEPIADAVIEFLQALDKECPEVFLMLQCGYYSPWWLQYGSTIWESGMGSAEAGTPSELMSPYARNSVIHRTDLTQRYARDVHDIPPLGKDTLGVWLSDWAWNGGLGKEKWDDAFAMDICRGNLLPQIWSDTAWLSPPERKQVATFLALVKARPECFVGSRWTALGDDGPYGYCCADGKRTFLGLHNAGWKDNVFTLPLNSTWGLPDGQTWDLYRWHPDPAKLEGDGAAFGEKVSMAMRPFEIVLLEVVPHGQPPTLGRTFESRPIPLHFAEASRPLEIRVTDNPPAQQCETAARWVVLDPARMTSGGGATLNKQKDGSILAGGENAPSDTYVIRADTDLTGITAIRLEALTDVSLPATGPGRVYGGNFALNEFRVRAWPRANRGASVSATLHAPVADFSQSNPGNWPVGAAIDGDPKTGWSIHPQQSQAHAAVFHVQQPLGFAGGTALEFTLVQGPPAQHNLGRFRLSVTTAKPPLEAPKPAARSVVVRGEVPASRSGGLVVVCTQPVKGSAAVHISNPGRLLAARGRLGGRAAACQPVFGSDMPWTFWQAWRVSLPDSAVPQPLELEISTAFPNDVQLKCSSYFLPK